MVGNVVVYHLSVRTEFFLKAASNFKARRMLEKNAVPFESVKEWVVCRVGCGEKSEMNVHGHHLHTVN